MNERAIPRWARHLNSTPWRCTARHAAPTPVVTEMRHSLHNVNVRSEVAPGFRTVRFRRPAIGEQGWGWFDRTWDLRARSVPRW